MRSDASMRPEPECDVPVGRATQQYFVGPLELPLVVIGAKPADDNPVIAPKVLTPKGNVASYGAAQLLVDREVPQKLVGGGAVELGVIDELLS
jgi:hypothetical protein